MDARQRLLRVLVPTVLVLAAAVMLFVRLDEPARIMFDETYYVNDARDYLDQGVEEGFAVHPPVGKWLIAAGIALFGDNPVGWRVMGAAAGTVSVWLVYLMGIRLFRRHPLRPTAVADGAGETDGLEGRAAGSAMVPAALAALLLATDGMFFVQARTGMLDIYLALFVLVGAWLLLVDHDRALAPERDPPAPLPVYTRGEHQRPAGADAPVVNPDTSTGDDPDPGGDAPDAGDDGAVASARLRMPPRSHLPRVLAGVAFGLAVATKWSGVLALIAAIVVCVGWELAARRRITGRWTTDSGPGVVSVVVALGAVPVAVYALSFVPWLASFEDSHTADCDSEAEACAFTPVERLGGLVEYHVSVIDFHLGLEAEHSYRAPAYTWPVMARPVVYYYETCSDERAAGVATTNDEGEVEEPEPCVVEQGEAAEIIGLGNPALWWSFLPATALLAAGIARRDRRALFIAAFYGVQFLPWLIVSRPVFFFYTVPIVPFMALGMGYAVAVVDEPRRWHWLAAGTAVGAAAGYAVGFGIDAATTAGEPTRWVALWVGALLGAAAGGLADGPVRRRHAWEREPRPGRWVALGVGILAVVAFAYFAPVWLGIHLPEEAVRARWWFSGWI